MTRTWLRWTASGFLLASLPAFAQQPQVQAPLVVHEWGTLTTVHMADGTPVGNLNRIDASEVLPEFVHRYEPVQTRADPKGTFSKSPLTPGRPDVTMRLEHRSSMSTAGTPEARPAPSTCTYSCAAAFSTSSTRKRTRRSRATKAGLRQSRRPGS